jgi:hypothetical protein
MYGWYWHSTDYVLRRRSEIRQIQWHKYFIRVTPLSSPHFLARGPSFSLNNLRVREGMVGKVLAVRGPVCRIWGANPLEPRFAAGKGLFCGQPVVYDDMCSLAIVFEALESAKVTCI